MNFLLGVNNKLFVNLQSFSTHSAVNDRYDFPIRCLKTLELCQSFTHVFHG